MDGIRTIELKRSVLADNDADAAALRAGLKARGTYLLNLMSSPGSGKTTLLAALAPHLAGKVRWGVMEADIDILFLSAKTGDGIPALAERILRRVRAWKAQGE